MKDSVVTGTPGSRARLAPGYSADGQPRPPWDFGQLGGAGAIESDVNDMLLYVQAYLAAPRGTLGTAMALAQKPRVPTPIVPGGIVQIGLGWTTNTRSGITFHNGETFGYHAFVAFEPSAQQGIVVLANVGDPMVDAVGLHVLVPAMVSAPSYAPAQSEPSPYAGVYRLAPTFAITIFSQGGQLYAQATGQGQLALTLISGHTYAVKGVDAQISFDVDAKGIATGLTLHQNGIDQHAPKAP